MGYIMVYGQTILLLECALLPSDRICQGYPLRTSLSLSLSLSYCVCLIFPLAKMINATSLLTTHTHSLIHTFIRYSVCGIQYSLICSRRRRCCCWCRHAGRPSLTHETSCFDKGALPQQRHRERERDSATTSQYPNSSANCNCFPRLSDCCVLVQISNITISIIMMQ